MRIEETEIPGVRMVRAPVFGDERGTFRETWRRDGYEAAGIGAGLVQDNVSVSRRGVVRGLHFQEPHGQGKLVSVLRGAVYDVALDVRVGSPTFGRWLGVHLSAAGGEQLWVPPGFAHGFAALEDDTVFAYRCTEYYHPECEGTVLWSDPALAIPWPVTEPVVAPKDAAAPTLAAFPRERLPRYTGTP